jgi:hypothetical protein
MLLYADYKGFDVTARAHLSKLMQNGRVLSIILRKFGFAEWQQAISRR